VSEQAETGGFVEEVGSLFEPWRWADGRECLSGDLSGYGAEEMARQFRRAEALLAGLESAAEQAVGYGALLVFGDAKEHAARARRIAEGYARKEA
jgi:hypothetical protein